MNCPKCHTNNPDHAQFCSRCGAQLFKSVEPSSLGSLPTKRPLTGALSFKPGDLILHRYRVTGALGQGGMGVVYKCFDEVGGIEVALKALPPELSHNTVEMEEVRENFRLVERLHHPNIAAVKTLEKDSDTGDYYLILELVEGVDLRRWRKQQGGKASLNEVLPILHQVAEALDYAHSQKIIHRDIKPSNVMVSPDGTVKVLDFGLAAQIQSSLSRVSQVHYGTSGTGPYMAPEQWRGQRQDGGTDQYALAVVAYELLAGHLPFEGHEMTILREAVLRDAPERIEGLTEGVWLALARGLAKDRTQRFRSCTAFVEALEGQMPVEIPDAVDPVIKERSQEVQNVGTSAAVAADEVRLPAAKRTPFRLLVAVGLMSLACWAGWQWMLKPSAERREKVRALRAEIQSALSVCNLADAEVKLAQLEQVDSTQALDLNAKYGQLKDAKQALDRKREPASEARERLHAANMDAGQGIGTKLSALEETWTRAETNRLSGKWSEAERDYQQIREQTATLESLERERQAAVKGRTEAQKARSAAEAARAPLQASRQWNEAGALLTNATALLATGRFVEAQEPFKQAAISYGQARDAALDDQARTEARRVYERLLARTSEAEVLKKHGGQEWAVIQNLARRATEEADPKMAKKFYDEARDAWVSALDQARQREQRAKVTEELQAATAALSRADLDGAEQRIQSALALDPGNLEAGNLRTRLKQAEQKQKDDDRIAEQNQQEQQRQAQVQNTKIQFKASRWAGESPSSFSGNTFWVLSVYVDKQYVGRGSDFAVRVQPGRHTIEAKAAKSLYDETVFKQEVDVPLGSTVEVQLN